jgi:hypothetical protein
MRKPSCVMHRGSSLLYTTIGLAALIAAGAPGDARAASQVGNSFVGETRDGHVSLVLARDGRQVTRAFVGYRVRCSDGDVFTDFDSFRAIPIAANRTFRFRENTAPIPILPGVTAQMTRSFAGTVNRRRTQARGTVRLTMILRAANGTVATCDTGKIKYTANS